MKKSKKILALIIGMTLLSSLFSIFAEEEVKNPFETGSDTDISSEIENPFDNGGKEESNKPGEYKLCKENEKYRLFYETSLGSFYVEDKLTSDKWYSSPAMGSISSSTPQEQTILNSVMTADILALSEINTKVMSVTSFTDSVKKGGQTVAVTDDGLLYKISFPDYNLLAEVTVTLTEKGIEVNSDTSKLSESKEYCFYKITLLPAFGAGLDTENGYIFVPDGSGSLILFNNKLNYEQEAYTGKVYSDNLTSTIYSKTTVERSVALPVFGIIKEGNSFLGNIISSAADAEITGKQASLSNNTNTAFATFTLRAHDLFIYINENKSDMELYQSSKQEARNLKIGYTLISQDGADYVTLAEKYREYLLEQEMIKKDAVLSPNLYLEIYGATMRTKTFLGIPILQKEKLTSFSQTESIIKKLKEGGVGNIVLRLMNWSDSTIKDKIPTSNTPAGILGGKSKFNTLKKYAEQNKISLYLDASPTHIKKGNNLFSVFTDYAQNLRNMASKVYPYKLNTHFREENGFSSYFLTVPKIVGVTKKLSASVSKAGGKGLSLTDTNFVYTDFRNADTSLQKTTNEIAKSYEKTELPLLFDIGNDYMLKTAEHILNVQSSSSHYNVEYLSIPFYQIALHGLVNTAEEAINESADYQTAYLNAVETGNSLYFKLIGEEGDNVNLSYDAGIYYANFTAWEKTILEMNKEYQTLLSKIYNQKIVGHKYLAKNVVMTTYENGIYSVVNYGGEAVTTEKGEVPAKGFLWGGDR